MKALFLVLFTAGISCAGPLGGPVSGFVLDGRSGSLRPVLGIPGAMQLGAEISLPFQITSADFDPSGSFAVVISNETPSHLYLIQNLNNPVITDMGAIADNSSVLAVNGTGQAAVLGAPGQLQFLTGIKTSPVLTNAIPAQALLGPISAAVLDDAGQCAVVGTSGDTAGALETLCADGTSNRILTQPGLHISSMALANHGQDAILADSAGQQILRVAGYDQAAVTTTLAAAQDGINTPVGLQVNGQRAIVADSAATSIFVIDLSGQTSIQTVALGGAPARLKFLTDRTVALLTDPTLAPFTIFDLQAMQSFFIPTN
jgi:hypothetical protein